MILDRLWFNNAKTRLWQWCLDEIVRAPLEPILHPSQTRLRWTGFCTSFGNVLFFFVWTYCFPQPFESLGLRLALATLGVVYFLPSLANASNSQMTAWIYSLTSWISLPLVFSWMYWMNGGNAVWLSSVCAMILIYYSLTDWRIASIGLITGSLLAWLLSHPPLVSSPQVVLAGESTLVIGFTWAVGFLLSFSASNLRRTRLLNTLSTMGVMAHELRTPLATVNLMGDVLRNLAKGDVPEAKRKKIEDLASRLQNLVKSMNRQVDTQISNAQLSRLPRDVSPVMAVDLVHEVVGNYPYRSSRERDCVEINRQQDFCFLGSRPLFAQVLSNLMKNALHSLASASTAPNPGDLRIDIGVHRGKGRIAVSDEGQGIEHARQRRIFEPFYSSQAGAGNGLGLTFCKNVVESAHGQISVHSEPGLGAVFMIDLPLNGTPAERTVSTV